MTKEFLTMADAFPDGAPGLPAYWSDEEVKHAAHAINSHDELVRLRDELLAALEAHEKFWTIREAELGELSPEAKAVRDNGLVAITAAKGTER